MIEFKLQHKVMHVVRTVSRKVVFGMFREETVWLSQRVVGHRRGKSEREAQTKSGTFRDSESSQVTGGPVEDDHGSESLAGGFGGVVTEYVGAAGPRTPLKWVSQRPWKITAKSSLTNSG
jgi:hypothetical protein